MNRWINVVLLAAIVSALLGFSGSVSFAQQVSDPQNGASSSFPTQAPLPIGIGTPRSVSAISSVGAATDGFRLELPPGRRGLAPTLALLYNSLGSGANAGVGWSLETGSIRRSAKNGIPAFDGSETFAFFLSGTSGDLVEVSPGEYRAEKESTYRRYRRVNDAWEVTDARGNRYIFGSQPENRVGNDVWMLERIEDLNGNYVTFGYVQDEGEIYLVSIDYTGHAPSATEPLNHVTIAYEVRSDARSTYVYGARQVSAFRPKQVVVTHDSSLVRTYILNYQLSASTQRSQLASIDVQGNGGGVIQARSFGYSGVEPGWTGAVAQATLPLALYGDDGKDTGVRPADVNGDGRADLLENGQAVWLGDGSGGFVSDPTWTTAMAALGLTFVDSEGRNTGTQLSDVNGDGRLDVLTAAANGPRLVYLNSGQGWVLSSDYSASLAGLQETARTQRRYLDDPCNEPEDPDPDPMLPACDEEVDVQVQFSITQTDGDSAGAFFADVNGDGLVDILWSIRTTDLLANFETQGGATIARTPLFVQAVFLNNGSGWTKSPDLSTELSRLEPFVVDSQFQGFDVLDVNGDGFADIMNTSAELPRAVYLNTTSGWAEDAAYTADLAASNVISLSDHKPQGFAATDLDGDGLVDLLRADESTTVALRNTGTGFVDAPDFVQELTSLAITFADGDGLPTGYSLLDFSADGRADVLFSKGSAPSSIRFAERGRADLLTSEVTALGESTTLSYELSSSFNNQDDNGVEQMPIILPFVTLITRSDGSGDFFSQAYDYEGAAFIEREYRGISTSTEFTSEGRQVVTSLGVTGAEAGRPVLIETLDGNGILRRREDLTYTTSEPVPGVTQVNLDTSMQTTLDPGASPVTLRVRRHYDEYLNLVDLYKDGNVSTPNDDIHEHYEFVRNLTLGFVAEIVAARVYGPNGELLSETEHYYDGLSAGQVERGNLTTIAESIDASGAQSIRTVAYDDFGNPIAATDGIGRTATFTYDASATFRQSSIDPMGRAQQTLKDGGTGLVTQETDANGATTYRQYDEWGRLVREVRPGDESSPFGTRTIEYSALGAGQSYTVRATETAGHSETFDTQLFYAGFGWVKRIETEGSGAQTVIVEQGFDPDGELARRTVPYFAGESSVTLTTLRDVLGRITHREFGDGTMESIEYQGNVQVETDRRGNPTTRVVDAFGQTLQVERSVDGETLVTQYAYDPFGRPLEIVDPGGNVTTLTYDRLGRRTALHDPVRGTIVDVYDAAGQLLSESDGTGPATLFTYNAAGDLTRKQLSTGEVFTFDYGEASVNGVGRVVRATDPAGELRIEYDARGNAIRRQRTTGGRTYVMGYEFDSLDRVRKLKYPDGFEVLYDYGPSTQPRSITDGFGRSVVSAIDYNATGQVQGIQHGNGVTADYTYDGLGRLLAADAFESDGSVFQSDRYTYDAAGNILAIANLFDPRFAQSFQYDALNRLVRAESSEAAGYGVEEYEYDAIGNLTRKGDLRYYFDGANPFQPSCVIEASLDDTATYAPRTAPNHPCSIGWSSPQSQRVPGSHPYQSQVYALHWDQRGNLLSKNSRSFAYDSEGRLSRVSAWGQTTERNYYSAAGQRVVRWTDARETVFIDELYETDWSQTRRHIPLGTGGRIVATVASGGRAPLAAPATWVDDISPRHLEMLGLVGLAALLAWLVQLLSTRKGRMSVEIFVRLACWQLCRQWRHVSLRSRPIAVAMAMIGVLLANDIPIAHAEEGGDASYSADQYYFYHQDHLGSMKAVTNFQGQVVERREYAPFGEQLYSAGIDGPLMSDLSYAGMELDRTPGAELYHARSRFYDSMIGRFTSPDIVVPSAVPEALNRYSFNLNNPVRMVDVTGRGFWDVVLGVVVVVALVAATIVTLGVAGVLTGLVLAIAVGAAIGAGVGAIAAVILAATGTLDSFSDGAFFTLAGALIGAAAGGAVGTAAAAFGAKATLISQVGFGAFAGGTLGAISGGAATLINGDTDHFLLGVVIGGGIGAAVGAVFGAVSLPTAVSSFQSGGIIATAKLVAALVNTSAGLISLSFNGTAEVLNLEKRIPDRVFKASLALGALGVGTPFIPVTSSGGEQIGLLSTSLGAL